MPFKEIDITIGVTGDAVTIASALVMPNGAKMQERETFRADGTETAATQYRGITHVANWVGPQVFALITKNGGEIVALITYQVSSDGQTLTSRTAGPIEQTVVFKRREF
jgi:surface antigen